jgi:hypothetical protein
MMVTMGCYMAMVFVSAAVVHHAHPKGWQLYFWSVLPAVPLFAMLAGIGRYLQEETDEYMRMVTTRSLLVGTGALLGTIVVSDFLRAFAQTGALPPFVLFVTFFMAYGIGQAVQQIQNRGGSDE